MIILFILLFLAPFVQLFLVNRIFSWIPFFAPSAVVAAVVFGAFRFSAPLAYTFAFLIGLVNSFLLVHPAGLDSIVYLIAVFFLLRFSSHFDVSAFSGKFITGFLGSLFIFLVIRILGFFIPVSAPSIFFAVAQSISTAFFVVFLFFLFPEKKRF